MAIGRGRGKGAEGRREGASWQRSVTGVCGPSTAICHIPPRERRASRRLHSGHMVLSRGLPYQVCSVSVPRQSLDWHTLPDVAKIAGGQDCQIYCWLGATGVYASVLFCARLYTPALSKSDTKPHNKSSVAFFVSIQHLIT